MNLKGQIRDSFKRLNLLVADTSRIGIELENDLSRLTALNPIRTIFDVGANHGQSALRFRRSFPLAWIYCFEPVSSNFAILQSNLLGTNRVKLINKGLGKDSGINTIGLSGNPGGHSLLLADCADNTEIITLTTIDIFCRESGLDSIDLLKIDVEGLEIDVLSGAKEILDKGGIRFVYAECIFEPDDSSPHTLFCHLNQWLHAYGFTVFACYHESFHLHSGSAMANVLFVNKNLLPKFAIGRVLNIT